MIYRRLLKCGSKNLKFFIALIILIFYILLKSNSQIPLLCIVEEHHEVLWYWFISANEGLITKSNSILIHIDAHPDDSIPNYIEGMPHFQMPANEYEAAFFLQRNDVFVTAAVITGLIDQYIWIYPSWLNETFEQSTIKSIGLYNFNNSEYYCECLNDDNNCYFIDWKESEKLDELVEKKIDRIDCLISKTYMSRRVSEMSILNKLSQLVENRNVVLNIDEDYFGCELASTVFSSRNNFFWDLAIKFDEKLSEKFCPNKIEHELFANKFLTDIVGVVLTRKNYQCIDHKENFYTIITQMITNAFLDMPYLFCGNKLLIQEWDDFINFLTCKQSIKFLKIVHKIGFCFNTSPKSLDFQRGMGTIVICHGLNEPTSTIVQQYLPKSIDLPMKRLMSLIKIIKTSAKKLNLVTISRSVRDGYTPRNLFSSIEKNLLTILNKAGIGENWGWEVNFDDDLYFGKLGWMDKI